MTKDKRGRKPNFVVDGGVLRHVPSGLEIVLHDRTMATLSQAHKALKSKLAAEKKAIN
jgi:hypothetical protein